MASPASFVRAEPSWNGGEIQVGKRDSRSRNGKPSAKPLSSVDQCNQSLRKKLGRAIWSAVSKARRSGSGPQPTHKTSARLGEPTAEVGQTRPLTCRSPTSRGRSRHELQDHRTDTLILSPCLLNGSKFSVAIADVAGLFDLLTDVVIRLTIQVQNQIAETVGIWIWLCSKADRQ